MENLSAFDISLESSNEMSHGNSQNISQDTDINEIRAQLKYLDISFDSSASNSMRQPNSTDKNDSIPK